MEQDLKRLIIAGDAHDLLTPIAQIDGWDNNYTRDSTARIFEMIRHDRTLLRCKVDYDRQCLLVDYELLALERQPYLDPSLFLPDGARDAHDIATAVAKLAVVELVPFAEDPRSFAAAIRPITPDHTTRMPAIIRTGQDLTAKVLGNLAPYESLYPYMIDDS